MKEETNYYEIALRNFKTAKLLMFYADGDETLFKSVAYHLQQTVELAIKHILFTHGVDEIRTKTHNLVHLKKVADDNDIELYLTDYLLERLDVITDWESKTRYVFGYYVAYESMKQAIDEIDKYFLILKDVLTN